MITPEDILYLRIIPSGALFILKTISLLFSLILLGSIIFFIHRTGWFVSRYSQDLHELLSYKPLDVRKYEKMWKRIMKRLQSPLESEYKLAIIEADNLLINVLEKLGYKGETSSEKLRAIPAEMVPDLTDITEAHKIRNHIIYDVDYRISQDKAKEALEKYEKLLKDLGAL